MWCFGLSRVSCLLPPAPSEFLSHADTMAGKKLVHAHPPTACRLHLFGVKSAGVAALASHPRVASIDSMAWDVEARAVGRASGGATMAVRSAEMRRWYLQQLAAVARPSAFQGGLLPVGEPGGSDPAHDEWGELLAAGECSLGDAAYFAAWDACWGAEPSDGGS